MKVTYTDNAKRSADGLALMQKATEVLETDVLTASSDLDDVLGAESDKIAAEWDRTDDAKGLPVYVLRLTDSTGTVSDSLTPDEFQSPWQLRMQLSSLFGELLKIRHHYHIRKMFAARE